jgi:hypothetical protein
VKFGTRVIHKKGDFRENGLSESHTFLQYANEFLSILSTLLEQLRCSVYSLFCVITLITN